MKSSAYPHNNIDTFEQNTQYPIYVAASEPAPAYARRFYGDMAVLHRDGATVYATVFRQNKLFKQKKINLSDCNDKQKKPVQLNQINFPKVQSSTNIYKKLNWDDNREACAWVYAQCFFEQSIRQTALNAIRTTPSRVFTKENAAGFFSSGWHAIKELGGFLGSLIDLRKLFFNRAHVKAVALNEELEGLTVKQKDKLEVIWAKIIQDGFIPRPNLLDELPRELHKVLKPLSKDLFLLQQRVVTTYKHLPKALKKQFYLDIEDAMGDKVGGNFGGEATPNSKHSDYKVAYTNFLIHLRYRFFSSLILLLTVYVFVNHDVIFNNNEETEQPSGWLPWINSYIFRFSEIIPILTGIFVWSPQYNLKLAAEDIRQSWNQFYQNIDTKVKVYERKAQTYQEQCNRLQRSLSEQEGFYYKDVFKLLPTVTNGDCFFDAVSLHVDQSIEELRSQVADYLEKNFDNFSKFFAGNPIKFRAHIKNIKNTKEWATHIEIAALQALLDRPIIILLPNKVHVPGNYGEFKGEPIFVYYNNINHYLGCMKRSSLSLKEVLKQILKDQKRTEKVAPEKMTMFVQHSFESSTSKSLKRSVSYNSFFPTLLSPKPAQLHPQRNKIATVNQEAEENRQQAQQVLNRYYTLATVMEVSLEGFELDNRVIFDKEYGVNLELNGLKEGHVEDILDELQRELALIKKPSSDIEEICEKIESSILNQTKKSDVNDAQINSSHGFFSLV